MTPQRMDTAITADIAPAPVTGVGDVVIRAFGTGVGVSFLTCAAMVALQQPAEAIGKASGVAFLVTTGSALVWLLLSVEAWRKQQRKLRLANAKLAAAYNAIRQLEYTVADQRATISTLQSQRTTPPQAVQPSNRVLSHNIAPDVVDCSTRIINHWFTAGVWYSRRIAKDAGWAQPTHDAAIKLLKDTGIVEHEAGKTPRIAARFSNHGATLEHFNNFCKRVADGPQLAGRAVVMSNDDDDD